ncbi:MAG: hypothetical protein EHM78_01965 [Myxococcaceae bacterium]|nr:MAG: hypothetical protein EHM78_01965 [Myxococcaceae bacterium]
MVSVLRQLQAEWNDLVPLAQARGVRRVRTLNGPLETIAYRRERLNWLRAQLGQTSALTSPTAPVGYDLAAFTFGVELEFVRPAGMTLATCARKVTEAGVECHEEGYNHSLRRHWKIVTDQSVGYDRGAEAVSPPLQGEAGFQQVRTVCNALKAMGCKVTVRCGLHVHIGARGESADFFKNVIQLYSSAESTIDRFMSPSRRGTANMFCQPIRFNVMMLMAAQTVDQVAAAAYHTNGSSESFRRHGVQAMRDGNRYRKVNLQSFWQHGTIEFRHHQGTVEAEKVINWVRFCLKISAASKEGPKQAANLDELMDAIKADDAEKSYFAARTVHFNRGAR